MATYWVSSAGAGTGDGSTEANAMSIATFESSATGGNTYQFIDGTYTDNDITPANSGSSGNPIIIKAETNLAVKFTTSGGSLSCIFNLSTNSNQYIEFDGIDFDGGYPSNYYTNSTMRHAFAINNSHHLKVYNCRFRNGREWACIFDHLLSNDGTQYLEFYNNDVSGMGFWNIALAPYSASIDDRGNAWASQGNSRYWHIYNNTWDKCGHDAFKLFGRNHIIRGNYFRNMWGTVDAAMITALGDPKWFAVGDVYGNRSVTMENTTDILIENNVFEDHGIAIDNFVTGVHKLCGRRSICRKNIYINNHNWGVQIAHNEGKCDHVHWYHNSMYNTAGVGVQVYVQTPVPAAATFENISIKNNSIYKTRQDPRRMDDNGSYSRSYWDADIVIRPFAEYVGDNWNGMQIAGNVWAHDESASASDVLIQHKDIASGSTQTLGYFETNHSTNVHDNTIAVPGWATIPPTQEGHFELTASADERGGGVHLTTVTSATGSGTSFVVGDSTLFCDGYGLIAADVINIGGSTRTISSIDHSTNTITVTASVSWTQGDGVNLDEFVTDYSTPDAGAKPYGAASVVTANNFSYNTTKNASIADVDVLANSSGATSVSSVSYTAGNGSTVAVKAGGLYVEYTPGTGFTGSESFTYTVTDGSTSDTATVTVNVAGEQNVLNITQTISAGTTGNVDFTSTGFGTPTGFFCFATKAANGDTPNNDAIMYLGFCDLTNSYALGMSRIHGQANATADRYAYSGTVVEMSTDIVAAYSTTVTDGVRINVSTNALAEDVDLTVVMFKNTSNIGVIQYTLANGANDITTIGFKPTFGILGTIGAAADADTTSAGGTLSVGFVHNSSTDTVTQAWAGGASVDGGTTSSTMAVSSSGCIGQCYSSAIQWYGTASAFDSSGLTITTSADPNGDRIYGLFVEWADDDIIDISVIDSPTATGFTTYEDASFTGEAGILVQTLCAAEDTVEADDDGGAFAIGAYSVAQQSVSGFTEDDAETANTITESFASNSNCIMLNKSNGTTFDNLYTGYFSSFISTGPRFNITAENDTAARKWINVVFKTSSGFVTKFSDTLVEGSNTAIGSHTPDYDANSVGWEGSGATVLGDGTGVQFAAANDYMQFRTGVLTGRMTVDWNPGSANNNLVLYARSDKSSENRYHALIRYQSDDIKIYKRVNNVTTEIATVSYTDDNTAVARCQLEVDANDVIYFRVDGDLKLTYDDSANPISDGGYWGVNHGTKTDTAGRVESITFETEDTPDVTGPAQVTTLVATKRSDVRIDLSWDSISGTQYYRVYGDTSNPPTTELTARETGTSYVVTGLTASTTYYFKVEAIDVYSNTGTASTVANATTDPADSTPPSDPTGIAITVLNAADEPFVIRLSWTEVSDGGNPVPEYYVYENGVFLQSVATNQVDLNLPGSGYTLYEVSALDYAGNESGKDSIAINPRVVRKNYMLTRDR